MKFRTFVVYIERECRMLKKKLIIPKQYIKLIIITFDTLSYGHTHAQTNVKFCTLIVYIDKECKMLKKNMHKQYI